eukprot:286372-Rhodomonas_salina.1
MDAIQTHEIIKQVQSRGEPFTLRNGRLTSNNMKLLLLARSVIPKIRPPARELCGGRCRAALSHVGRRGGR